jgi:hypothetical protein
MINVNKLTSTLAKLSDLQLQTYAKMNPDPYTIALAVAESNRRKEMRAASQAPAQQEQPKVVDQMVAEMAPRPPQPMPEDLGIARIPAGEMNFAGGGIVAFADGGDIERYSGEFGSLTGEFSGFGGMSPEQAAAAELRTAQEARLKQLSDLEQKTAFLKSAGAPQAQAAQAQLDALKASMQPKPSPTDPNFRRQQDLRMREIGAVPAVPVAQPLITSGAAPKADTTQRSLSGAPAATAAAADKDVFGLEALQATQKKLRGNDDYEIGALRNQLVEIKNRAETQAQSAIDARKAELAAEGDVYKDRSDRLVERATKLKGQEGKNTGLALLNAGLAIMSTPGSLATAIGKGAQVGTAQYAAGIKDLRAAQERLDEANDRISDLRLNRKDMNAKEIRSLERERDAALRDGEKMVFGFAEKVYGLNRKDADTLFSSYMSGQEKKADIQSRETTARLDREAANARSNAPTSDMRETMLLGTGNTPEEKYLSGLKVKKELMGDRQGTQLFKMFLEENGRREKNMEKPLTLEQFRRTSAAFFAPPAAVDTTKPNRP